MLVILHDLKNEFDELLIGNESLRRIFAPAFRSTEGLKIAVKWQLLARPSLQNLADKGEDAVQVLPHGLLDMLQLHPAEKWLTRLLTNRFQDQQSQVAFLLVLTAKCDHFLDRVHPA